GAGRVVDGTAVVLVEVHPVTSGAIDVTAGEHRGVIGHSAGFLVDGASVEGGGAFGDDALPGGNSGAERLQGAAPQAVDRDQDDVGGGRNLGRDQRQVGEGGALLARRIGDRQRHLELAVGGEDVLHLGACIRGAVAEVPLPGF